MRGLSSTENSGCYLDPYLGFKLNDLKSVLSSNWMDLVRWWMPLCNCLFCLSQSSECISQKIHFHKRMLSLLPQFFWMTLPRWAYFVLCPYKEITIIYWNVHVFLILFLRMWTYFCRKSVALCDSGLCVSLNTVKTLFQNRRKDMQIPIWDWCELDKISNLK